MISNSPLRLSSSLLLILLIAFSSTLKAQELPVESLNESTETSSPEAESFMKEVGDSVKKAIEPVTKYTNLVLRYKSWFSRYREVEQISGAAFGTWSELFAEEYAKADEKLVAQECALRAKQQQQKTGSGAKQLKELLPGDLDTVDFVFRALANTIDGLESRLAEVEHQEPVQHGEDLFYDAPDHLEDPEKIELALERIKRTSTKAAKTIVTQELHRFSQIATAAAIAKVAGRPELQFLGPIAQMLGVLGSASTPLAVQYLRSVQAHVAFTVLSRLNPAHYAGCLSG